MTSKFKNQLFAFLNLIRACWITSKNTENVQPLIKEISAWCIPDSLWKIRKLRMTVAKVSAPNYKIDFRATMRHALRIDIKLLAITNRQIDLLASFLYFGYNYNWHRLVWRCLHAIFYQNSLSMKIINEIAGKIRFKPVTWTKRMVLIYQFYFLYQRALL